MSGVPIKKSHVQSSYEKLYHEGDDVNSGSEK